MSANKHDYQPPRAISLTPSQWSGEWDSALDFFARPPADYRATPFWAWNAKLEAGALLRQIDYLQRMGFGGFVIHARTGLDTPYLGPEFIEMVRLCVREARARGMRVWLYDEDRYPSGFAGGVVTREPRFRQTYLRFTSQEPANRARQTGATSPSRDEDNPSPQLLACYGVVLERGVLVSYRRLPDGAPVKRTGLEQFWYAYLEKVSPEPWYNGQAYVDTLNPAAVALFIAATHDRYAAEVGEFFGTVVPAIYTDEPHVYRAQPLEHAGGTGDALIPFTADFFETYRDACGQDLVDDLPELFWNLPGGRVSLTRYRYYDHLAERFTRAFADQVGHWCDRHHLNLTGHLLDEETLGSQTAVAGEAMRAYRSFGLPGVDVLGRSRPYAALKQAQSVARQYSRAGVMSELYGVTNWDFDFASHKSEGDWQVALGVTARVPHLAWVSMRGEAKRDYPASINYQSPWFHKYALVEDHFSRLNTVLTRGRPCVRVGVIHPIESYWLCTGPLDQTRAERERREEAFVHMVEWLLFGLLDFDFIAESLLPTLAPADLPNRGGFHVGAMSYDAVVVPDLRTIRATTLDHLERFAAHGGIVVVAGAIPDHVDARPSARPRALAERCACAPYTREAILHALEPLREIAVTGPDGCATTLVHQMRADGDHRYLFLCNANPTTPVGRVRIIVRGYWDASVLETLTGARYALPTRLDVERTVIEHDIPAHGSLLLALAPRGARLVASEAMQVAPVGQDASIEQPLAVGSLVPVSLSEPNVLLLDHVAYRIGGEGWHRDEELLRVDAQVRARLGLPPPGHEARQPWTYRSDLRPRAIVHLRFTIDCAVPVEHPSLACEDVDTARLWLDGEPVDARVTGWFVDEAIQTIALPPLGVGRHDLILAIPYAPQTHLEWCYLLGSFGVTLRGHTATIVAPVRALSFGDWTIQGLPFYAGNLTYHCSLQGNGEAITVRVPDFKNPLLSVELDGRAAGDIVFPPFTLPLGPLAPGRHDLAITAYGNRYNAFGALHNADPTTTWYGPPLWRTSGAAWTDDYRLKPMGILSAPLLLSSSSPAG